MGKMSEQDRALFNRVCANDLPYTTREGMIIDESTLAALLDAARTEERGEAEPVAKDLDDVLRDPATVHINMLRGGIAKLSPAQIGHLYRGDEAAEVVREVLRQNPDAAPRNIDAEAFFTAFRQECAPGLLPWERQPEQVREQYARAAGRVASPGWLPIETAPKDGTVIDVWRTEGGRDTVFWGFPPHECGEMGQHCDSDWHSIRAAGWVCNTFGEFLGRKHAPFTHWRPITPPLQDGGGK